MNREIQLGDDTLDSNAILAKLQELLELEEAHEEDLENETNKTLRAAIKEELDETREEIEIWQQFEDYCQRGEQFINEDYFVEYTKQLVRDCYEVPEEMDFNKWPWCHLQMDWEAAAEALQVDYSNVEVEDETYWVRS